ncbi:hypothetical protein F5879DRAFT_987123 [Lentinula edodes]|uniref:uncharacterized protein n=1 Tax=Lentinula edodes TaxID=5353 RepID=UPI001E8E79A4|nr:uncharacterized protein C8R40DRAFT_1171714 [Lentinula edodes]KAH7874197.1 hypothetical protein C8R40DRAFT_1171714 [Lentinula edodes]KAJ3906768.1 hypothetical protein F5879DRAFT_987123 [Lentinula edodes]
MKPLHEEMWNIVLGPNTKTYFVDLFPAAMGHNRNLKIKNAALPKNLNDHRSCRTTISLVNAEGSDIDTLNQPLVLCTLVPMIIEQVRLDFGLLLNSEACYILVEGPNPVNICMQAISSTKQRTDVIDHARTQSLSSSQTSPPSQAKCPNANGSLTASTSTRDPRLFQQSRLGKSETPIGSSLISISGRLPSSLSSTERTNVNVTDGARTPQSTHNKRQSLSSSYNSSPSGIATKGPNVNGNLAATRALDSRPGNMKVHSQPFPLKSPAVDSRSHETKTNSTPDGSGAFRASPRVHDPRVYQGEGLSRGESITAHRPLYLRLEFQLSTTDSKHIRKTTFDTDLIADTKRMFLILPGSILQRVDIMAEHQGHLAGIGFPTNDSVNKQ